jgi:hypothetical protein
MLACMSDHVCIGPVGYSSVVYVVILRNRACLLFWVCFGGFVTSRWCLVSRSAKDMVTWCVPFSNAVWLRALFGGIRGSVNRGMGVGCCGLGWAGRI